MAIEIKAPRLHKRQRKIWKEGKKHRNNVVRCGRRWGKTIMLVTIAFSYAVTLFRDLLTGEKKGGKIGIFTAEYRQYQEIYDKLVYLLGPLVKSHSRSEKRILLKNGGVIDFWVTNDNELAGRGREYHVVLIDEAAFTKAPQMLEEIWPKSISPTMLTTKGRAWVFSTPDGIDENNFFYAICRDKKHGFYEHHAPTSTNPLISAIELAKIERDSDPRVFRQEFLAEFVDWSKDSLFDVAKLLVDDKPVMMPATCDMIFAVMDTGLKGGSENDGHGVVYYALEQTYEKPRLTILDWDLTQIQGSLLPEYMPHIFNRLDELTRICHPRMGSVGTFIENAAMGAILLQKGETEGWPVRAIDSVLTSKGKDERGVMASGYHYTEKVKISEHAYKKTSVFKNSEANHFWKQVSGFHLADKKAATRADDLLDCYTYGVILAFGNSGAI
ncbi:terminase large subunit domain-containing protein [Budvicia aquatica]|uniref:Terminase n=1 Tax=Budvicia aquatica TaxID=82979 RepID=A0A2C6DS69_9GAMM|nr:terminase family protein [Budvicia aquatica]PHI31172.1 terminase [Budvicia aquatica]